MGLMLRLKTWAWCLSVCLAGAAGGWADEPAASAPPEKPGEAVELVIEGAVLTPSADGAQLELKLEPAQKSEAGEKPQPAPKNPAPKGLQFQIQAVGGQPQQQQQTSVTRTMSVIATTGIEDAEAKQELEALADRLTKGAEKLEAEGQKEAAVKKRAAADMLRGLTQPAPAKMGMFQIGTPGGAIPGVSGDVEVKVLNIGTPVEGAGDLEARIRVLKEKIAGVEQAGGDLPANLKQKLKAEIEGLVQKMVGDQGKVFAFVESEVVTDDKVRKIEKADQPPVVMPAKPKGGKGGFPDPVAALEKLSRMAKETGNHEEAGRLWDEAQALKGKLAKPPQGDRANQIAALENESRKMKESGQHEMAEKLWDKAQALKAEPSKQPKSKLGKRADQIAALEKESQQMKESGQHEMAEKLWDKAQALKGKLAKQPQGDRDDQIAALENESRKMKDAGQHEMAEKLWDKAQALKAERGPRKPEGPDDKLVRTLRELQEQITDLRNEVRELKERAGR
jgi:tetratricopeptide (TPR) repeat protein